MAAPYSMNPHILQRRAILLQKIFDKGIILPKSLTPEEGKSIQTLYLLDLIQYGKDPSFYISLTGEGLAMVKKLQNMST